MIDGDCLVDGINLIPSLILCILITFVIPAVDATPLSLYISFNVASKFGFLNNVKSCFIADSKLFN